MSTACFTSSSRGVQRISSRTSNEIGTLETASQTNESLALDRWEPELHPAVWAAVT